MSLFSPNCTDFIQFLFKSIIFQKKFCKIMSQFFEGGGGRFFFIFVTISNVTITLGRGGVSPNLIKVINFTVYFFLAGFPWVWGRFQKSVEFSILRLALYLLSAWGEFRRPVGGVVFTAHRGGFRQCGLRCRPK